METETNLVIDWKNVDCRELNTDLTRAVYAFGQEMARLELVLPPSPQMTRNDKITFDLTVRVNLGPLK